MHAAECACQGFIAEAAPLYWQAQEGGLSYAIEIPSSGRIEPHAHVKNIDFSWNWGWRVGFGYQIPHDSWVVGLAWISLQTHSDAHSEHLLLPVWQTPFTPEHLTADQARAHWRLHLGLVDLVLHKTFHATSTLTLSPQCGVRFGSVRQKYNVEYQGGDFSGHQELSWRMKNKFWGLGPYVGLKAEYILCRPLRLFAKAAASLLEGQFYLHQDASNQEEKIVGLHQAYSALAPMVEWTAGVGYQQGKHLSLDVAWDQLVLYAQNQLVRVADTTILTNQGDLSVAGIHVQIAWHF